MAVTALIGRLRMSLLPFALLLALLFPAVAAAHGPTDPVASSYLARLSEVPDGVVARILDGDQRLWLAAPARSTVIVLGSAGAGYLRFSPAGVSVNENSEMYYLNAIPGPAQVPSGLSARTPPRWVRVSSGHSYAWHDGRLHALAAVALAPGSSYAGRWRIPLLLDGRSVAIEGGLWHANDPSLVWLWPVLVLIGCALAARRLSRPTLDALLARGLAGAALPATVLAAAGRDLQARPSVAWSGALTFAVIATLAVIAAVRLALDRAGYFSHIVVALVALWEGLKLLPILRDGFVLTAVPPFAARAATVVCLGCGVALLLFAVRLAQRDEWMALNDRRDGARALSRSGA